MTSEEQTLLTYFLKQFEDEIKHRAEFYDKSARVTARPII